MGIEWSGMDDFADGIERQTVEGLAEQVAQSARDAGLATAESIEIQIEGQDASGALWIDPERVRARANEILAAG